MSVFLQFFDPLIKFFISLGWGFNQCTLNSGLIFFLVVWFYPDITLVLFGPLPFSLKPALKVQWLRFHTHTDVVAHSVGAERDSAGEAWTVQSKHVWCGWIGPWRPPLLRPIWDVCKKSASAPPSSCTSLVIWGIRLHYSATLRLYCGFRMRTQFRKRRWREMVDFMMKEGHIFLLCLDLKQWD